MAKLDMKKLAINHVEKFVFGLVAVFSVWALWSADWTPYRGTSGEIEQRVEKGAANLKSHDWPETEKQAFRVNAEDAPANVVHKNLLAEYDAVKVAMPAKMAIDWFGNNDPVREPTLLALTRIMGNQGRVFLERLDPLPIDPASGAVNPAQPAPPAEDPNVPDEFRRGSAARLQPTEGSSSEYDADMSLRAESLRAIAAQQGSGDSFDRRELASDFDSISQPTNMNIKGKGYSFISVRALFHLRDQIEQFREAIHRPYDVAAAQFNIQDFELQRQEQLGAADQWSEWAPVDIQIAVDILKDQNQQADVVDSMITNPVITMPLPARITGEWRELATHPGIKNFELTDAQMDWEYEMNKVALLESAFHRKNQQVVKGPRRGFASLSLDNRTSVADLLGGRSEYGPLNLPNSGVGGTGNSDFDSLVKDLAKYSGSDEDKKREELIRQWLKKQVDARGELLLFRYLDFGVQPGKTYRYRARLIVSNPNFNKPLAAAGGLQHVVEGETRETPWSEITGPITVEKETQYFVKSVSEPSYRVFPVTYFDVFEWNTDKGTTINSPLDVPLGAYVGGEQKTKVIDAAKRLLEEINYRFRSPDYLVDASSGIPVDRAFHAEGMNGTGVKLTSLLGGQLAVPPQAVVRTAEGTLKYMSPPYQQAEYVYRKQLLTRQEEQFADLRSAANASAIPNLDNPDAQPEQQRGSKRRISGRTGSRRGYAARGAE